MFDSLSPVVSPDGLSDAGTSAPLPTAATPLGLTSPAPSAPMPTMAQMTRLDPVTLLTEAVTQMKVAIAALTNGVDRESGTLPGVIMSQTGPAGAPATAGAANAAGAPTILTGDTTNATTAPAQNAPTSQGHARQANASTTQAATTGTTTTAAANASGTTANAATVGSQNDAVTKLQAQMQEIQQDLASLVLEKSSMFANGLGNQTGVADAMMPFPAPSFLGASLFSDQTSEPAL